MHKTHLERIIVLEEQAKDTVNDVAEMKDDIHSMRKHLQFITYVLLVAVSLELLGKITDAVALAKAFI